MKIFVLATLMTLASGTALACPGNPDCKDGQCKLKKSDIVTQLGLAGDKADAVRKLQASYQADHKALKQDMHALKANYKSELAALLSEEELAKVEAMMAHHGHHDHAKGEHSAKTDKPHQCDHKKGEHQHP